jgi:hypothetical protein
VKRHHGIPSFDIFFELYNEESCDFDKYFGQSNASDTNIDNTMEAATMVSEYCEELHKPDHCTSNNNNNNLVQNHDDLSDQRMFDLLLDFVERSST